MSTELQTRKILLGITGGIAAYKAAELCRLFVKAGAEVQVVMTDSAQSFISPLSLQALSGNPVRTTLLDPEAEAGMGHIELAKWADAIVIAPASANFIAKMNAGIADDLLSTLVLATEAPLLVAPAMNQAMWSNPVTQRNMRSLAEALAGRLVFLAPDEGEQACGDVGPGRLMAPEAIFAATASFFSARQGNQALRGKRVVITAGPTQEAIDPVRFLTNHSSGKMGFALAEAFYEAGASVTLIAGPVNLCCRAGIHRVDVLSAQDMLDASLQALEEGIDVFVGAAAVADYKPSVVAEQKIKKQSSCENGVVICLEENPDIIATIASQVNPSTTMIGFAAETQDVLVYARGKLEKKGLDMVVANDVSDPTIGFNSDENAVVLVTADAEQRIAKESKLGIARKIVSAVSTFQSHH